MVAAVMSKPHCICFISAKGGSGKTVLSASLGRIIAALGRPVTIADCDAATNGLTLLYLPQLNRVKEDKTAGPLVGMFDFMAMLDKDSEEGSPSSIPIAPSLSLVPATFTMASTERVPVEEFSAILDRLLASLDVSPEEDPGYLILDAQAGTDPFAYAAVKRADDVIIVSEYDPVSAEGIERLKVEFGPRLPLSRTWTLFNKLLPEFATEVGDFLRVAAFLPPMPWDADVIRAFAQRALAIDLEKGNTYTLGVMSMAKSLRPYDLGSAIDVWKEQKAGVLREPIATRLSALDRELESLERTSVEISYELKQRERRGPFQLTLAILATITVAALGLVIPLLVSSPTKSNAWLYAGIGVAAAAMTGVVASTVFITRTSRESPIELEATKRSLERQIRDLAEERARYHALMSTDTDKLLSEGRS